MTQSPQAGGATQPEGMYLAAMTAIRGLMAIWVVLYHGQVFLYNYLKIAPTPNIMSDFLAKGYMAVDFFFILSGFILTYVYRRKLLSEHRWKASFNFITARMGRIFPLHIALLAAFIGCQLAFKTVQYLLHPDTVPPPQGPGLGIVFSNLLLIQNWPLFNYPSWNGSTWSLSTEWFAYWCFLWLLPAVMRLKSTLLLVFLVLLLLPLYWLVNPAVSYLDVNLDAFSGLPSLWRCLLGFTLGVALQPLAQQLQPRASFLFGDVTFGVGLFALVTGALLNVGDPLLVVPSVLLVFNLSQNKRRIGRWLSSKPLHWLGEVSYSIYLAHMLCLFILMEVVPYIPLSMNTTLVLFEGALLATTLPLSHLTYHYIEVPCRDFLRERLNYDALSGQVKQLLVLGRRAFG